MQFPNHFTLYNPRPVVMPLKLINKPHSYIYIDGPFLKVQIFTSNPLPVNFVKFDYACKKLIRF